MQAQSARAKLFKDGQIARLLADLERDEDPALGLLEACRRAGAMMRLYAGRVGELAVNLDYQLRTLPDGTEISYPESWLSLTTEHEAEVHFLVKEYQRAIDQYAKICKLAIDAGIAAAAVRVEAEKAQVLARAVQSIFHDLDLTPAQRAKVPALVRRHLLELPGTLGESAAE